MDLNAPRRQEEGDEDETETKEVTEEGGEVEDDDEEEEFQPSQKIALQEQIEMDKDDESLRKWKEDLLKNAVITTDGKAEPEVEFRTLRILVEGRPPIELSLGSGSRNFVLKERCKYRLEFEFAVRNELLVGLQYSNKVWRLKRQVDKAKVMLGVYAPQAELYHFTTEEETTPHGMLARGHYTAKTIFSDDDGKIHFEYDYTFEIRKEWDANE